ncbi:MAG: hypothetical protein GY940_20260, partial [bacterium]|nr:hypothetical protein [bacterium]
TKLAAETRFLKVKLQKKILVYFWETVTNNVKKKPGLKINLAAAFKRETNKVLQYKKESNGDISVTFAGSKPITLTRRDIEHYFSVAYTLRTILAVQQEAMLRTGSQPVALDGASVSTLKEFLDVFTLAVLQLADRQARLASEYELSPARFQAAWDKVQGAVSSRSIAAGNAGFRSAPGKSSPGVVPPKARFAVISNIILEKVKSYGAYN